MIHSSLRVGANEVDAIDMDEFRDGDIVDYKDKGIVMKQELNDILFIVAAMEELNPCSFGKGCRILTEGHSMEKRYYLLNMDDCEDKNMWLDMVHVLNETHGSIGCKTTFEGIIGGCRVDAFLIPVVLRGIPLESGCKYIISDERYGYVKNLDLSYETNNFGSVSVGYSKVSYSENCKSGIQKFVCYTKAKLSCVYI